MATTVLPANNEYKRELSRFCSVPLMKEYFVPNVAVHDYLTLCTDVHYAASAVLGGGPRIVRRSRFAASSPSPTPQPKKKPKTNPSPSPNHLYALPQAFSIVQGGSTRDAQS